MKTEQIEGATRTILSISEFQNRHLALATSMLHMVEDECKNLMKQAQTLVNQKLRNARMAHREELDFVLAEHNIELSDNARIRSDLRAQEIIWEIPEESAAPPEAPPEAPPAAIPAAPPEPLAEAESIMAGKAASSE